MKKIFVLAFVIIMTFSLVACSDNSDNQVLDEPKQEETVVNKQEQPVEELDVYEPMAEQSAVDAFIKGYNTVAPTPITDTIEIDVTDMESGHYRTEFRLSAFDGAIAKTGKIGDITIDIVNCGWQKDELRIYVEDITPAQAAEIVKFAAPIMDTDVPSEDLQDVLDYLTGTKDYHNGYFGGLCMTFNEIHGELMLRTD